MKTYKATMHRQGREWITSVWDSAVGCYRESQAMSYWEARAIVGATNCRNPEKCQKASHIHS